MESLNQGMVRVGRVDYSAAHPWSANADSWHQAEMGTNCSFPLRLEMLMERHGKGRMG